MFPRQLRRKPTGSPDQRTDQSTHQRTDRRTDRQLLASILLCPLAAISSTIVGYTVAHWVCDVNRKTDCVLVSIVNFAVCFLAAGLAYGAHRRLGGGDDSAPEMARRRFMAKMALILSAFAALVVLAGTVAVVTLQPCD